MSKTKTNRFIRGKGTGISGVTIYIDRENGVEYVISSFGGFSPLYDPDGTIKVSKDFKELDE